MMIFTNLMIKKKNFLLGPLFKKFFGRKKEGWRNLKGSEGLKKETEKEGAEEKSKTVFKDTKDKTGFIETQAKEDVAKLAVSAPEATKYAAPTPNKANWWVPKRNTDYGAIEALAQQLADGKLPELLSAAKIINQQAEHNALLTEEDIIEIRRQRMEREEREGSKESSEDLKGSEGLKKETEKEGAEKSAGKAQITEEDLQTLRELRKEKDLEKQKESSKRLKSLSKEGAEGAIQEGAEGAEVEEEDVGKTSISEADIKKLQKERKEREKELEQEEPKDKKKAKELQKKQELEKQIEERDNRTKQREEQREKKERERSQANKDLSATADRLAKNKKKTQGGISGFLKSINNLGMGKYRVEFIQNLAMMVNAGLPLIDAIKTLQMDMKSKPMKKVVRRIQELVENGQPLWLSMEDQYMFSPYEVALVRVGEEAGNLARNLQYLAEQQEKDRALRAKVKMAMIYPSIVMVLMFVVVMGLGFFVLPNLVQVLFALNAELPITTKGIILFTELFTAHGSVAVPGMIIGMIVFFLLAKFTRFRVVSQWMIFHIPGIGTLARHATIARFGVILGGLLDAGVPLVESLSSLEDVTHIASYKRMYGIMTERIALGDSFSICFKSIRGSTKMIPSSMQQLIITGERSGTLSQTFGKIAEIYEKKAEETAEKLPTILEPMLLLFIGGLVGTIAFSIILPIYSVIGNVG